VMMDKKRKLTGI